MSIIYINESQIKRYPVTKHFGPGGDVRIKVGDFTLVEIHYDYRYTSNAHRRWLADRIVELLTTPDPKEGKTHSKDCMCHLCLPH